MLSIHCLLLLLVRCLLQRTMQVCSLQSSPAACSTSWAHRRPLAKEKGSGSTQTSRSSSCACSQLNVSCVVATLRDKSHGDGGQHLCSLYLLTDCVALELALRRQPRAGRWAHSP